MVDTRIGHVGGTRASFSSNGSLSALGGTRASFSSGGSLSAWEGASWTRHVDGTGIRKVVDM